MSRKWTDAVRAEGVDSTDRRLQGHDRGLQGSVVRQQSSYQGLQEKRAASLASGVSEEHSRSSMNLFMTSRQWQRERVAGCLRFWRECFCQQCIWCDCSQLNLSNELKDLAAVAKTEQDVLHMFDWSGDERLGVQIGW